MTDVSRALLLTLLATAACASDGKKAPAVVAAPLTQGDDQARPSEAKAASGADAASDLAKALALLASQERVRPANFYRLESQDEPAVCNAALKSLNQPYAVPEDLHTRDGFQSGERDYAAHQAAYYLGTNDNIRWSVRKIAWPNSAIPPHLTESAFIDFYGDGVDRLVVRVSAQTRGGDRRQVFAVEFIEGRLDGSVVNSASLGGTLPDDNGFGSKIDFSVADVIKVGERYYALIMPLRDYDKSGRVYFAKMYDRGPPPGNQTGHEISHWFPKIICTFMPTQS